MSLHGNYGEAVALQVMVVTFIGYRPGTQPHGDLRMVQVVLLSFMGTVQEGDRVKKGQQIALTGSSGRSTGPHLHFMVEKDGVLVDPLQVLKDG